MRKKKQKNERKEMRLHRQIDKKEIEQFHNINKCRYPSHLEFIP